MQIKGEYGTTVIHATVIDNMTIEQVKELMNQKFIKDSKVRIMPDCHAGKGCVIGTTMNIKNSCVPNLVGVDIGCGMFTVPLGKVNIDLEQLDNHIKDNIPSGENIYETNQEYKTNIKRKDKCTSYQRITLAKGKSALCGSALFLTKFGKLSFDFVYKGGFAL